MNDIQTDKDETVEILRETVAKISDQLDIIDTTAATALTTHASAFAMIAAVAYDLAEVALGVVELFITETLTGA